MNWRADGGTPIETLNLLRVGTADPSLRVVVLAAHPDDETIGASKVLSRFSQAQIIFLTDGAPRDRNFWPPNMQGTREQYAEVRKREAAQALAHAGIPEEHVHWLGAVDQESILSARVLANQLADLLARLRTSLLITHPYEGGHPDHDCAALVARIALRKLGNEAPLLSEMTSYHAHDERCVTGEFLNSDPSSEIHFDLDEGDRERKRRMMDEYKSQRLVLKMFPVASERLRVAPEYDFTKAPHESKLWYEHMGWTTGERWRELAA